MNQTSLPDLQNLLQTNAEPHVIFLTLLPLLGEQLQCDRCFLYLRNPHSKIGKIAFCWRRNSQVPEMLDPEWKAEPESLVEEDPMFAAAVHAQPSIFVEDVETASPETLNRDFERQNFGHRALIHSHLRQDGLLWGILQPCVFGQPRTWTNSDRELIAQVETSITPMAISYVKNAKLNDE